MKKDYREFVINEGTPLKTALKKLDELAADAILFTVDDDKRLKGSLTDGDVRRGLIKGFEASDPVEKFAQSDPKYICKSSYSIDQISSLRGDGYKVIPILNGEKELIDVLNFRYTKTYLPIDAVIMAGGRGKRLKPLTDETPKPLLEVGGKPIIEHNIDRLIKFGVDDIWLTVNYLGEQIEKYFRNGDSKNVAINYVYEENPLGTAGSLSLMDSFQHDHLLVMNSDLLTNIDFEEFYMHFIKQDADLAIAAVPYSVQIPYAVLETSDNTVISFKEKPTYTYHSNAGMYLLKKSMLKYIPKDNFFNITDLIEILIEEGKEVVTFSFSNYWLDIGKPEDFEKAQEDIKHLPL